MQNSRKKRKGYPICLDWITPGCEFKRCPCWCNECRGEMCQLRFLQAHLQEHGLFHFAPESAVIPPTIRQKMEGLQTPSPEVDCSEAALAHDFIHVSESKSDDDVPGNIDKCEDQELSDEEEELQHFEYDAECQRLILDCNEGQDEEQVSKAALGESSRSFMKGSKRSVFSIALAFLDAQVATGISNRSMSVFLRLFTEVLSELDENTCFPKSTEEIHKIVEKAAPSTRYIATHACYNDCKLFEGELENAVNYPDCGVARYKRDSRTPRKVFRRFPLIPALQQKARCPEFAKRMSWCCNNSSIDGIMRGPIDGQLFQKFLQQYPEFSTNTLFFSLFGDGVSPTRSRNSKPKTCWPFGLICLNLPPDEGIRASNIHLAFIAPGPKQVKKVDTYLRPLVEELKLLKEGVEINGTLWKAVLMYTTHDYPGFSVCSGLKTSGYYPCPACGPQFRGEQSQVLNKIVYVGHRQFLEQDDPLRRTKLANFNGEIETRPKPVRLGPNEWLKKWEENPQCEGMKRLSIFYELDYFGSLEVRFTLDFMHILKNVAEQIWRYIMGGKLLNFDMSRIKKDLENGNSKPELWNETKRAPWLATSEERRTIMQRIAKFRVPTSYCAASLQFCGEEGKLEGLTSHDYLHLIRDILPIVLTGTLSAEVRDAINSLSVLVRWLSCKEIPRDSIPGKRIYSAQVVVKLESVFPRSFMTTQVHALIHLVDEVHGWGPPSIRSMFAPERYMKVLKDMVRQKAFPEASMAEGWHKRQLMLHANEYLEKMERLPWLWSISENKKDKLEGRGTSRQLVRAEVEAVTNFVIHNEDMMVSYLERFKMLRQSHDLEARRSLKGRGRRCNNRERIASTSLPLTLDMGWLKKLIEDDEEKGAQVDSFVREISYGCSPEAKSFPSMYIKGKHFRVKALDDTKKTMDCIVICPFECVCISHRYDREPLYATVEYAGQLQEILEVDFGSFKRIIFGVDWFKVVRNGVGRSPREEENGLYSINTNATITSLPHRYVYASMCEQAYLHEVPGRTHHSFLVKTFPRSWLCRLEGKEYD